MRVLVVGRAKTGTTALMSLVKQGLGTERLVMEPGSVLAFGQRSVAHDDEDEVIKVVHEHWRGKWRHLDALVHAEFGFTVHKVVFVTRDVRDQMVSKLLYHAKIARAAAADTGFDDTKLALWVAALEEKERQPDRISFTQTCERFQAITGIDIWSAVTNLEAAAGYENYVRTAVTRDHHVLAYEDMVADRTTGLSDYLGFSLPSTSATVDLGRFGYTKRSARSGNWRSWFTDADVEILRPLVGRWLDGEAYHDWDLTPVSALDPEEGSRYVRTIGAG